MLPKPVSVPSTACPLKNAACFGPAWLQHLSGGALCWAMSDMLKCCLVLGVHRMHTAVGKPESKALCEELQRHNEKANRKHHLSTVIHPKPAVIHSSAV